MSSPEVRLATEADLATINAIHSHYVTTTTSTYALQPLTLEERLTWFTTRPEIHPVTVVEDAGVLVAWGALGTFRFLGGYRTTAENSVYVHPDHLRKGYGSLLLRDQIARARSLGLRSIVAVVDSQQTASLSAHKKQGYKEVGRMPQVARKFDQWRDAVFLQIVLD